MAHNREQLSASLEDYLEAIFHLSAQGQVARSKDIADRLHVARPSVTGALRSLASRRLIHYKPYGFVTLTRTGNRQAQRVVEKHRILKSFFTEVLGIKATEAQEAACRAEHALGPEIVDRLMGLTEFLAGGDKRDWVGQFRAYCRDSRI
ncbi:MAG: metal-dependent transcriptional regulator [Phycisphaerae bacterium]|nr:metal-dependent transcriptional regulator [Phycisphaerae bacterium]